MPVNIAEDREQKLAAALKKINKDFGDRAVVRVGDAPEVNVDVISAGIESLNLALGAGGWPKGRIIEIYGPNGAGKTLLVLKAIAQAQKEGGLAAFIDMEQAFDPIWAKKNGVDIENLYLAQPGTGEEALNIAETLVLSGAFSVIAVDSVATLVPKAEIEGEFGMATMGLQARLMSQALRKLTPSVSASGVVFFFTNQLRKKIGVVYGNPEVTAGGEALPFYASVRVDVRRKEFIKDGADVIGQHTLAKIIKNKVGRPYTQAEYDVYINEGNEGVSYTADVLNMALKFEVVKQSGAWISWGANRELYQQGREKARIFLDENPDVVQGIVAELRAKAAGDAEALMGTAETTADVANTAHAEADAPAAGE